mmetsp:Transcript_11288/g.31482  ORF Transcript_11288/g.31482 Transcript_11288/m.31482 type:complete len:203 (+) Transcript_11288:1540-2148(+)
MWSLRGRAAAQAVGLIAIIVCCAIFHGLCAARYSMVVRGSLLRSLRTALFVVCVPRSPPRPALHSLSWFARFVPLHGLRSSLTSSFVCPLLFVCARRSQRTVAPPLPPPSWTTTARSWCSGRWGACTCCSCSSSRCTSTTEGGGRGGGRGDGRDRRGGRRGGKVSLLLPRSVLLLLSEICAGETAPAPEGWGWGVPFYSGAV